VSVAAVAAIALGACGSSKKAATGAATTAAGGTAAPAASGKKIGVALILKTLSNPFFISMQKSAEKHATEVGNVDLKVSAGTKDGDDATQIAAIENAISAGYKGILITPTSDAVVPAINKARAAGLLVIALDTPPNPASAVDITFATDNFAAGELIGKWAAGKLAGGKAVIAMLDLFDKQIVSVDLNRDQGFLKGMGITVPDKTKNGSEAATGKYTGGKGGDYEIACHVPTNGATPDGKTAMETCLSKNPNINVVYTINEPAAVGASDALKAAGKTATIVSVDGGCKPGLESVKAGIIGATSQQYPGDMATKGIDAIVTLANGGAKPAVTPGLDFFNTGVKLVTDTKIDGVDSISVADGEKICWG
jgi:fructose transport system substrate-binding protein